jgi:hypothetical protein
MIDEKRADDAPTKAGMEAASKPIDKLSPIPGRTAVYDAAEEQKSPTRGTRRAGRLRRKAVRSGCEQLLDLVHQLAQVEGLRENLRVAGRAHVGIERHRGEPGDEHHLDVGIELGRPPG